VNVLPRSASSFLVPLSIFQGVGVQVFVSVSRSGAAALKIISER
jgi:hypothetical protein